MKQLFLLSIFCALFIVPLQAHGDKTHFGYGEFGSIGGYPAIGGGYRMWSGHHGFDISGKTLPWIPFGVAEVRGAYLFYPKQKGLYFGGGVGLIRELEIKLYGNPTFDVLAGYQWKTARGRDLFFQVEGIAPFKKTCCSPIWPAISFGIGF